MGMRRLIITSALIALFSDGAAAQFPSSWRFMEAADGPTAGLADQNNFFGLWLVCDRAAKEARLHVQVQGADLPEGSAQPVLLKIDGESFNLSGRAEHNFLDGIVSIVRRAPLDEFAAPMDALAKGSEVEITTVSGTYTVPLKGSAGALKSLRARCA